MEHAYMGCMPEYMLCIRPRFIVFTAMHIL